MMAFPRFLPFLANLLLRSWSVFAAPVTKRAEWKHVQTTEHGDVAFALGNVTYLANIQHPKAILGGNSSSAAAAAASGGSLVPFTVIFVEDELVTGAYLQSVVASYLEGDDVLSEDFLQGVYLARNGTATARLDNSALAYLGGLEPVYLFLDTGFQGVDDTSDLAVAYINAPEGSNLTAGPYAASISEDSVSFGMVYRLYRDEYRDFLYGTYDSNDGEGTFYPVEIFNSRFWGPMIPVSSRIYSWSDTLPFAEYRRIVDLGGVLMGKFKLAQFASGANPWEWQDEHYPFNPRGDGWLTCSASSSGGGCSIAAYDWLDFAIGSDTGSSMRRPAAVSGTFGNRPSQGMMTLEQVMPLGAATDTAGVFSRDVRDWVHFAKHWYTPEMHQNTSITGLSPLETPDSYGFPKRILYLTDYLPLANPTAEAILQAFIQNMTSVFGMTVEDLNLTAVVASAPEAVPKYDALDNATGVLDTMTQYQQVAAPLMSAWAEKYDGRFPPIDPARRSGWREYNDSVYTTALYDESLATKRAAVDWFESQVLYATPESCSESIMLWDIGTGGLPSYREEALNTNNSAAAFLAVTPLGAGITGASLCPIYGCVDMTIPIGQVAYFSNVTFGREMVPVTVSVVARRGCDFMLWNMWERLADEGVLRSVKRGRTAL
ncbi:Uu.00g076450.m01.CDS01 [Anthostomella pinea]|uniref:Uu.00g076450.m01.CDS01 n=1 Tax=Anthostomella pinea TaxID=933095 RepID=A0AAI8YPA1_9PEZI|nr:Uu.00g076450.m01.CDS01 [Anthostomella pinea]